MTRSPITHQLICVLLLAVGSLGCQRGPEPIATYSVPKSEVIQVALDTRSASAEEAEQEPARMLAALILVDEVAWSFKSLAAPDEFPEDAGDAFRSLIKSLKFENAEKPTWELGERWQEKPGTGMRTANLYLDELEVRVFKLPAPEEGRGQYELSNINRWRGQVGMSPIGIGQLSSEVETVQTQDGREARLLDIVGVQSDDGMGPMAGRAGRASMSGRSPAPRSTSTSATARQSFNATAPDHWEKTKTGMMQLATYVVESEGQSAKVSVARAGGGVLPNINRWRGQVQLAPVAQLADIPTESVSVSGEAGLFVELQGKSQTIVVAMVPADNPTWFFKLQGDNQIVQDNVEAFQKFLSTVELQ